MNFRVASSFDGPNSEKRNMAASKKEPEPQETEVETSEDEENYIQDHKSRVKQVERERARTSSINQARVSDAHNVKREKKTHEIPIRTCNISENPKHKKTNRAVIQVCSKPYCHVKEEKMVFNIENKILEVFPSKHHRVESQGPNITSSVVKHVFQNQVNTSLPPELETEAEAAKDDLKDPSITSSIHEHDIQNQMNTPPSPEPEPEVEAAKDEIEDIHDQKSETNLSDKQVETEGARSNLLHQRLPADALKLKCQTMTHSPTAVIKECPKPYCHVKQEKMVFNIEQQGKASMEITVKCATCNYRSSIENWKPPLGVIYCPKCQSCEIPLLRTKTKKTNKLYSMFGIDCIQHCWPLCFIPYLFPPTTQNTLLCAQCFSFLGTYDDHNKSVRPNQEYSDFDHDSSSADETKRREQVQYGSNWTEYA